MLNFVLNFVKRNHLFGSRAKEETRLIIKFVIYFGSVNGEFAEVVLFHVGVELLLHHTHVLDLVDGADDARADLFVVLVPDEVLRV